MLPVLNLTYVPRWSIVPIQREQSVAEHSWRVAVIADRLASKLGIPSDIRYKVVFQAVFHDAEEAQTGDIPHPVKVDLGIREPVTGIAGRIVKVADYIEAYLYIQAWCQPVRKVAIVNYLWKQITEVVETYVPFEHREDYMTCIREVVDEWRGW